MEHLTTRDEIWTTLYPFLRRNSKELLDSLVVGFDAGWINSVSVGGNTNSGSMRWDGLMHVHFAETPDAVWMVNRLISPSQADEINMVDDKTLRLWWD